MILSVRPDGSDERVLLRDLPVPRPVLDWSPDGRWIVMTDAQGRPPGVFLLSADGTQLFQIAPGGGEPAWRPETG